MIPSQTQHTDASNVKPPSPVPITSVFTVVANMITEAVPVKKSGQSFQANSRLIDIKMDSLEVLSIAMDLEEHYDLHMTDEEIATFDTVNDIVHYLEKRLAEASAEPTTSNPTMNTQPGETP